MNPSEELQMEAGRESGTGTDRVLARRNAVFSIFKGPILLLPATGRDEHVSQAAPDDVNLIL